MFRPATSAKTRNRSLFCRTTSKVLVPIEPVQPRIVRVRFDITFLMIPRRTNLHYLKDLFDFARPKPLRAPERMLQGSFSLEVSLALVGVLKNLPGLIPIII